LNKSSLAIRVNFQMRLVYSMVKSAASPDSGLLGAEIRGLQRGNVWTASDVFANLSVMTQGDIRLGVLLLGQIFRRGGAFSLPQVGRLILRW